MTAATFRRSDPEAPRPHRTGGRVAALLGIVVLAGLVAPAMVLAASPTVTINQAAGQTDPTGSSPINFTVVFSEAVTGFTGTDVTITGTAGGTKVATVTGSGTTYNVAVTGMTTDGTVIANVPAAVAQNGAMENNLASTSTDNSVTWDNESPSVTINQAAGQIDPTGTSPINFTVQFSEAVTGFSGADVTLSGTAGATTALVTPVDADTYTVAVSGMTAAGTVTASIAAGHAIDGANNPNLASTSTDNTVTWAPGGPTVTINQAAGQTDPTGSSPINFTVVFSEAVTGFTGTDVTITGTAGGTKVATVTGSGTTYNVAVTGMTTDGTVIANVPAAVAQNGAMENNLASTSTDNSVTWDNESPSVTINQAAGQIDPTGTSPILFTVQFSEAVTGFTGTDVAISGTAGGIKTATVTGSGTTYNVAVTGMTTAGTVIASISLGVATDLTGNPNLASTSTDNTVTWAPGGPTVTVNQAAGQVDPTGTSPINFTVVFSEAVTGFTGTDVVITGTAGGTKVVTVTGSGATYNVAITGMTTDGTVIANVPAGVAVDSVLRPNVASTSVDNSVTWVTGGPTVVVSQASGQADPTGTTPINFTVVFSQTVTGFTASDVVIGGTAGGTKVATITGSGTTYNVAVTGMTTSGTVTVSVPASVALDASNRPNAASTSTDNTVTWSAASPAQITITTSAPMPRGAKSPVITWSEGFNLTVQIAVNGTNRQVQVQGTRDGVTWTTITTLTTNAAGQATLTNYRPPTNLYYRAVFAGAVDLGAATSPTVRTVVRQIAILRPTNVGVTETINRNSIITFTVTVRPSRPELTPATVAFFFYRKAGATWQLQSKRNVVADSFGSASTTWRFTLSGQWYVRAQANPTPYNANSVLSPVERYNVR